MLPVPTARPLRAGSHGSREHPLAKAILSEHAYGADPPRMKGKGPAGGDGFWPCHTERQQQVALQWPQAVSAGTWVVLDTRR